MSELILREWNGKAIRQREDGYLSATDMCQACGKRLNDWIRLDSTKEYLNSLESVTGIPVTESVQVFQGGVPENQGTWIHRKLSIRLAQWLNTGFAVQVDTWVEELLLKGYVIAKKDTKTLEALSEEILELKEANKRLEASTQQAVAESKRASALTQKILRYFLALNRVAWNLYIDLLAAEKLEREENLSVEQQRKLAHYYANAGTTALHFLRRWRETIEDSNDFLCTRQIVVNSEKSSNLIEKLWNHIKVKESSRKN